MEQTNIVVTPDGKTWDEVTRNTSYIGNKVLEAGQDTILNATTVVIFDDWRGASGTFPAGDTKAFFNKDFAIAYDRVQCLKDGQYAINTYTVPAEQGVAGDLSLIHISEPTRPY